MGSTLNGKVFKFKLDFPVAIYRVFDFLVLLFITVLI